MVIDIRKYYRLPETSDNVIAFWSYDWLTLSGKPPILICQALPGIPIQPRAGAISKVVSGVADGVCGNGIPF